MAARPDSRLLILALDPQATPGTTRLEWTSQPTRRYRLFSTENLVDWSPAPDAWILPSGSGSTDAIAAHPDTSRRFFKIQADRPLAGP